MASQHSMFDLSSVQDLPAGVNVVKVGPLDKQVRWKLRVAGAVQHSGAGFTGPSCEVLAKEGVCAHRTGLAIL